MGWNRADRFVGCAGIVGAILVAASLGYGVSQMVQYDGSALDPTKHMVPLLEDVDARVQAIETMNSGASDPAVPRPWAFFADTTAGYLTQWDAAGTAKIWLWFLGGRPIAVVPKGITFADTVAGVYTVPKHRETLILVNASGGAITIDLPATADGPLTHYWIFKVDTSANAVTVQGNGGAENIGSYSASAVLRKANDMIVVANVNDGITGIPHWYVVLDKVRNQTAATATPYAAKVTDELILMDTGVIAGVGEVDLPAATNLHSRRVTIKQIGGAFGVNVDPGGSYQIDNLGVGVKLNIAAQNARVSLESDGAQWWQVD